MLCKVIFLLQAYKREPLIAPGSHQEVRGFILRPQYPTAGEERRSFGKNEVELIGKAEARYPGTEGLMYPTGSLLGDSAFLLFCHFIFDCLRSSGPKRDATIQYLLVTGFLPTLIHVKCQEI